MFKIIYGEEVREFIFILKNKQYLNSNNQKGLSKGIKIGKNIFFKV